jgi:hypothetical protein
MILARGFGAPESTLRPVFAMGGGWRRSRPGLRRRKSEEECPERFKPFVVEMKLGTNTGIPKTKTKTKDLQ